MSSQKKKTPAEELLDSILDEVGSGEDTRGFAHFSHEGLADAESPEAVGAKTEVAHSLDSDEDSIQIAGLVNQEKTVVADMNFGGLLKKGPKAQPEERTQVYQPEAKTEVVKAQHTQVQTEVKTQVLTSDAKTQVQHQAQTQVKTEILNELKIDTNYATEDLETAMQNFEEQNPEGEFELEGTHAGEGDGTGEEENTHNTMGALELDVNPASTVSLEALEMPPDESAQQSEDHERHQATVVAAAPKKLEMAQPVPEPESPGFTFESSAPKAVAQHPVKERPSIFDTPLTNDKTQLMTSQESHQILEPQQPSPDLMDSQVKTVALNRTQAVNQGFMHLNSENEPKSQVRSVRPGDASERTVAVTGFQIKPEENLEDKVKVSVGKQSRSSGFASWGSGVESNLSQAENLRMAQEKILELENENEKLRRQNEELIAASEILRERSDLMTSQLTEFKNDRESLEQSFKSEMTLMKNHVARKDAELKRALIKVDELESRLKFDLKKIRVRERELENRLELVRAEKNAISKNKDEQILDLRRKMDVIQMEVDSYRQKCVELNKQIENSQDSFKRTTRALRLAMANLELQEENKAPAQPLKKAE